MRDFAIDPNGRKPVKTVASFNGTEQKLVLECLDMTNLSKTKQPEIVEGYPPSTLTTLIHSTCPPPTINLTNAKNTS